MNTITYKELQILYLSDSSIKNAKKYFKDIQPDIYATGFYSSPSWNWGYIIGIVGVKNEDTIQYFEVVTQFGQVVGAREINLPTIEGLK